MASFQFTAAAIAAAIFVTPAFAQMEPRVPSPKQGRPTATPPAAPAPAPPAAQPPASQAQQPQGQALSLTEDQKKALGAVHWWWVYAVHAAEPADQKASATEVKDLARRVFSEGRRLDAEFQGLMAERGVDGHKLPQAPDTARIQQEVMALAALSGEPFDREFVAFYTRNGLTFVNALKHARDITPGRDARLKKFLDDAENVEEGHLDAARQLKVQRQARTPPPPTGR